MELLIAGDLVPTDKNEELFIKGNTEELLGKELETLWFSSDIRIFNLETPLTNYKSPINKNGPNLSANPKSIHGIKNLNPSLITLANNHILDHGIQGLKSTKKILNTYHIPFIGAGKDVFEASKPYIFTYDRFSIGVYTCTDYEFSIATEKSPGANPFDPLESLDHIEQLKAECDYVVVLYHGGKEHYRYPSPYLQKVCRKMVEKGANIVICQHSHCIGAFENYMDSTIIYGQGNFIFNKHDNEFWNTSLLVKLKIENKLTIEYIPIVRTDQGVKVANEKETKEILSAFYKRSERIKKQGFIERKYKQFAKENIQNYLRRLSGTGRWSSRIDRWILNGALIKLKYNRDKLLAIQNYIMCEAHRELLLKGLEGEIERE